MAGRKRPGPTRGGIVPTRGTHNADRPKERIVPSRGRVIPTRAGIKPTRERIVPTRGNPKIRPTRGGRSPVSGSLSSSPDRLPVSREPKDTPFLSLHFEEDGEEHDGPYVYSSDKDTEPDEWMGDESNDDEDDEPPPLKPLGDLRGSYTVVYVCVSGQYQGCRFRDGYIMENDFTLIPSNKKAMASFDFGVISGDMRFAKSPIESSWRKVKMNWRGEEIRGDDPEVAEEVSHKDEKKNTGWVRFLGGGVIEGHIDLLDIDFMVHRKPEQKTQAAESDDEDMELGWDD